VHFHFVRDFRHIWYQISINIRDIWTFVTAVGSCCMRLIVPDPGEGVCAGPVNRGPILEGEGPGPPCGDKERQLSPDRGRGKMWQNEEMAGSQGRLPLHGFKTRACTEWVPVHSPRRKCVNILVTLYLLYLLFQENKSFGAITICIHPLMYKKPCREHLCLRHYFGTVPIETTISLIIFQHCKIKKGNIKYNIFLTK
jgi:hypothetical protein